MFLLRSSSLVPIAGSFFGSQRAKQQEIFLRQDDGMEINKCSCLRPSILDPIAGSLFGSQRAKRQDIISDKMMVHLS
jgi:hypothetical protein